MFKEFMRDLVKDFWKYVLAGLVIGVIGLSLVMPGAVHSQDSSTYYYPQSISVINKTLTNANTEYSQAIPDETRQLFISERSGGANVKVAMNANGSGTTYFTVKTGSTITLDKTYLKSKTLYMQSTTAGAVVEILSVKDE